VKGDGIGIVTNIGKNTVINHILNEMSTLDQS